MSAFAILPKGFKTEMIFPISTEARLFFSAVVIGALFGLLYDVLRIFRRVAAHNDIAVFIEDFLFVMFCAFWYYIFVTAAAWGQIRFFVFIGMLIGMVTEVLLIGDIVVQSASVVIGTVIRIFIAKPMGFIVRIAKNTGRKFVQCAKVLKFNKKREENA